MDQVSFGGAELSLFTLSRALAQRCAVHLALYEGSLHNASIRQWYESLTKASVNVHRCPMPLYPGPRRNLHPWLRRRPARYLAELMDEVRPDVVLANVPTVEHGQTVLDAAELARTPVDVWGYLHSAHHPTTAGARWRLRDMLVPRQLRRFKHRLLTVSESASKDMSRHYGVDPAAILYPPVVVIPDEPELPTMRALWRAAAGLSDRFLLGIVGRVHFRHKGQDAAMRVVAQLHTAGYAVHLVVIGDGPDLTEVGNLAEQLRIPDRVSCLGWRPDANKLISLLDALVITSRHEGMPLTALEAAAARVPIVAYGIDGLNELLPPEFRVPYGDEVQLADTIARLMRGVLPWPANSMSLRARTWSNPEGAAERLLSILDRSKA
jgi:glycosyltransferase involved in cell wall biosynthesis